MINLWFFFLFLAAQSSQPDNLYSAMVVAGTPAPFTGILFTPEAATKILVDHRTQLDQLAADMEYKRQVEIAGMQLQLDQTKILLDTEEKENEFLKKENENRQLVIKVLGVSLVAAILSSGVIGAVLLFNGQ